MNHGSDDRSTVGRPLARAAGAAHSPDITPSTQSQPTSVAAAAEPDPITALMFALLQDDTSVRYECGPASPWTSTGLPEPGGGQSSTRIEVDHARGTAMACPILLG